MPEARLYEPLQQPVAALKVPREYTSLYESSGVATLDVTGDPSTVRHHFLIHAVPVLAERADAAIVKTPDTVVLLVVVHPTDGSEDAA